MLKNEALIAIGNSYGGIDQQNEAIECFDQCIQGARDIGDHKMLCGALCGLGLSYASLGDVEKSIDHLEESLRIAREIGARKGEPIALCNVGSCLVQQGERARGKKALNEALAFCVTYQPFLHVDPHPIPVSALPVNVPAPPQRAQLP